MTRRYFAIVPAAGQSARMGQAKLVLPLQGRPLIAFTLQAWQHSGVDRVIVIVRPDDEPLANVVRAVIGSTLHGAKSSVGQNSPKIELVIPPSPPPDMKASVQLALAHIQRQYAPAADDAFLLAPADMPRLSAAMVDRLLAAHRADSPLQILAPSLRGKRGHPVLFSWQLAAEASSLAADEGLDAIVRRHPPRLVPCDDLAAAGGDPFADVDTPEEYLEMTKNQSTHD